MHNSVMQPSGNQGKAKVGAPATKDKKMMPPATAGGKMPHVMCTKPMPQHSNSMGKTTYAGV